MVVRTEGAHTHSTSWSRAPLWYIGDVDSGAESLSLDLAELDVDVFEGMLVLRVLRWMASFLRLFL